MSFWRPLARGLRRLTNSTAAERDFADEISDYVERAADDYVARGLSREEAILAARRELGSVSGVTQELREYGWEHSVGVFVADMRHAMRALRRRPAFAAVTISTLALGVGVTTAIFSAWKPIALDPLPLPAADRLTMIWEMRSDGARADGTFGMFRGLVDRTRSFEAIAVFKPWQPTLTDRDQPERLDGQRVSAGYFRVLGVTPAVGRPFGAADDEVNGPNVVILSDAIWKRRFGGDPAIVGRQIVLDSNNFTVIGVMPAGFENVLAPSSQAWAPMQYGMAQDRAWGHHLHTVARLRPGISRERATEELDAIGNSVLGELRPASYGKSVQFIMTSLQDDVIRDVKPALLLSLGAVILVLVIACVNVTNLLLARAIERRGEFAMRTALGAARSRLIRQILTESLLLAVVGGTAGMAVAAFGVRALVALGPPNLPRVEAIVVDKGVFLFGLAISTLIGFTVGVIPAVYASRHSPNVHLPQAVGRATRSQRATRGALVVAEVSVALALLVCSGLLWRSLESLFGIRTGFDSANLLTLQVQTSGSLTEPGEIVRFVTEALDAVRNVPGVTSAGATSQLPLSGDLDLYGVHFDPTLPDDPGELRGSFRYAVSPGYLETMRIPLLGGRFFDPHDREDGPLVALVSESLAKRRLGGRDPIGHRLRIGPADGPLYTVIGVVGDVRQASLAVTDSEAVYTTAAQWRFGDPVMSLVVRTRGNPARLVPALQQAIWSVDRRQPIVRVATMDDLIAGTVAVRRFALTLIELFALAAVALTAAGLYGVLGGSVAERTREIGIRAALGASRTNILALVVREGLLLTGLGIAIGLVAAATTSRALTTMLFGVSPLDPTTYAAVIGVMIGVAAVACWRPAWQAVQLDPANTLRAE